MRQGYADDSGVSSVFCTDYPNDQMAAQLFLTAALSKSYPSLFYLNNRQRNRYLDIVDKRIDGASQCLSTAYSHLFAIRSGHHKIFLVDIQTGITRQLADLSSERKNVQYGKEKVAVGMISESLVHVFWKTRDDKLILKSMKIEKEGCHISSSQLENLYRSLA